MFKTWIFNVHETKRRNNWFTKEENEAIQFNSVKINGRPVCARVQSYPKAYFREQDYEIFFGFSLALVP